MIYLWIISMEYKYWDILHVLDWLDREIIFVGNFWGAIESCENLDSFLNETFMLLLCKLFLQDLSLTKCDHKPLPVFLLELKFFNLKWKLLWLESKSCWNLSIFGILKIQAFMRNDYESIELKILGLLIKSFAKILKL